MATTFTTPHTWSVSEVVTADNLNTYLRDNTSWLGTDAPVVHAFNSVNIETHLETLAAITCDSERFDNNDMHDVSSNTERLTVQTGAAGKYLLGGSTEWDPSTSGTYRSLGAKVNGTTVLIDAVQTPTDTNGYARPHVATMYAFDEADYFELYAVQDAGDLNILSGNIFAPHIWAMWIRT